MSNSYPFLALARKNNMDYGLVLSYADFVKNRNCCMPFWQAKASRVLPEVIKADIRDLVDSLGRKDADLPKM